MTTWILFTPAGREIARIDAMNKETARRLAAERYPRANIGGMRPLAPRTNKVTQLLAHPEHSWRIRDELTAAEAGR